ncbi:MAG TPA: hypothetical protein VGA62_02020, partial [Acidimicrobiia bacterium]
GIAGVDIKRELRATSWDFPAIVEPVAPRSRRPRRIRRLAIAAAAVLASVAIAGIVSLSGGDHSRIETPRRQVPTTIPDLSKTHAIVVTPSTGLRDRQIVRVSGRFAPPRSAEFDLTVSICRAGVTPATAGNDCDGTTGQGTRLADPFATVPFRRYPYMIRRMITVGGQSFDCAAAPGCVLYAAAPGRLKGAIHSRYSAKYGVAPLAFDPVAPPEPGPTVTVTPPDALRDGDTVTVRGRHFRPLQWTSVTVCVRGTEVCDGVGINENFKVDANGSFSVTHSPWSVFSSADGIPQDCHVVTCVVRVKTSENVDVPVSFAPADTAAYPQLTLDPAGPYTDGQQVTVTVQGWPGSVGHRPGLEIGRLKLGVCADVAGVRSTECGDQAVLQGPDADGRYTTTLTLHRTGPFQVDCTQPGNCRVALALGPLGFDPPGYFAVILGADVVVNQSTKGRS